MRLWHYKLISVLPNQHILGQWRELSTILGNIKKFGKANSSILNKITEYNRSDFIDYINILYRECIYRGLRVNYSMIIHKLNSISKDVWDTKLNESSKYNGWMNNRYLKQCYYNLQEKYDCNVLTDDEWNEIHKEVSKDIKVQK